MPLIDEYYYCACLVQILMSKTAPKLIRILSRHVSLVLTLVVHLVLDDYLCTIMHIKTQLQTGPRCLGGIFDRSGVHLNILILTSRSDQE